MRPSLRLLSVLGVAACASDDPSTSYLVLTVGDENDAWTRSPAPTEVVVFRADNTEVARRPLPLKELTLPDVLDKETVEFRLEARDASGLPLLIGFAGPVVGTELAGNSLPVFVSRVGEFARLPGEIGARKDPLLAVIEDRFLLSADSNSTSCDLYDLLSLAPLPNPPTLPRIPKTILAVGKRLLLISDTGASFFDLTNSTEGVATFPFDPSDVAGGAAIQGEKGNWLLVGNPTRATRKALRLSRDGVLSAIDLSTERLHPTVSFAAGIGFIVAGGAPLGSADIEVLPEEGTTTFPLSYVSSSDPTVELAAAAADDGALVVADGASIFRYDLRCRSACSRTTWKTSLGGSHPVALLPFFGASGERGLYVGRKDDGESFATLVDGDVVAAAPFRVPHFGARHLALGARHFFLGGATKVELFTDRSLR